MASESAASRWNGGMSLPGISFLSRHRRTTFLAGFVFGLALSVGSLSMVFFVTERRRKGRRKRRLANLGLDQINLDARERGGIQVRSGGVVRGVEGLIGHTPLMRINSLSDATGCEILGKAEFLNPGGSPKDRVALQILRDAEEEGLLHPNTGSTIFEGTVGSTGISLAVLARAKGYKCSIVIPDDVAQEKVTLLRKLGAQVEMVRPRGIVDPRHFVNEARARAEAFGSTELVGPTASGEDPDGSGSANDHRHGQRRADLVVTTQAQLGSSGGASAETEDEADALELLPRGFFADQFENPSNFWAHYHGTGREISEQCGGVLDAFVAGAGTGGTLSGVATYLKQAGLERSWDDEGGLFASRAVATGDVHVVLADPQGSGLYNRIKHGVMYAPTEAEGKRRRHQVDTVVEGIGINRLTHNFEMGMRCVDDAERVTDDEAARMARWLVLHDGLFLGSSSAVNCVAAVRTALKLKARQGPRSRPVVVTILCDSGVRHLSKFHDDEALRKLGVDVGHDETSNSDISDILAGSAS